MNILINNSVNIISASGNMKISGSLKEVSRVLNLEVLKHKTKVRAGDTIAVLDDGKVLFFGYVFEISSTANDVHNSILAYDPLIYLKKNIIKSAVYGAKDINFVVKSLIAETELKADVDLPKIRISIKEKNKSVYDCIKKALDKLPQRYHIYFENGLVKFKPVGDVATNVVKYSDGIDVGTIITKNYKYSLNSMINKVITDKGRIYTDDKLRLKYGTISAIGKDRTGLKKPSEEIKVGIIADWSYVSGSYTALDDTGYLITADEHHYSGGIHTADLTLKKWGG